MKIIITKINVKYYGSETDERNINSVSLSKFTFQNQLCKNKFERVMQIVFHNWNQYKLGNIVTIIVLLQHNCILGQTSPTVTM